MSYGHLYAKLFSREDWLRATGGDPSVWSYDERGMQPVEPEVFASRAGINVWTSTGKWDGEPTTYPCLAVRELREPDSPQSNEPVRPQRRRSYRHHANRRGVVTKTYAFPPETPEKLDLLCEAYRMRPGQVLSRLVDEAYRRDVVESGLLAVLGDDVGIIAPVP